MNKISYDEYCDRKEELLEKIETIHKQIPLIEGILADLDIMASNAIESLAKLEKDYHGDINE